MNNKRVTPVPAAPVITCLIYNMLGRLSGDVKFNPYSWLTSAGVQLTLGNRAGFHLMDPKLEVASHTTINNNMLISHHNIELVQWLHLLFYQPSTIHHSLF